MDGPFPANTVTAAVGHRGRVEALQTSEAEEVACGIAVCFSSRKLHLRTMTAKTEDGRNRCTYYYVGKHM